MYLRFRSLSLSWIFCDSFPKWWTFARRKMRCRAMLRCIFCSSMPGFLSDNLLKLQYLSLVLKVGWMSRSHVKIKNQHQQLQRATKLFDINSTHRQLVDWIMVRQDLVSKSDSRCKWQNGNPSST